MLEKFTKTFDRLSDTVIHKLNEFDENSDINLGRLIALFTLDVVCGRYFGRFILSLADFFSIKGF